MSTQNGQVSERHQEKFQALLMKSATDMEFRGQLLENPREAIYGYTGNQLPETIEIKFVENQADATIVVPPFQDAAELTEEELEAVAGGVDILFWTSVASVVATIGYIFTD